MKIILWVVGILVALWFFGRLSAGSSLGAGSQGAWGTWLSGISPYINGAFSPYYAPANSKNSLLFNYSPNGGLNIGTTF